jgi:7-cyano-7-deazaguanine synthase in queuosine biosynthesis
MAPQTNHHSRPTDRIIVAEKGYRVSRGNICRDGVDIQFRANVLPAFFFRTPDDRIIDLMRVIASVAHADRRIPRRPSICWGRDIELDIPVSDPDFWVSEIAPNLIRLLNLLSGDSWSFSFRRPKQISKLPVQQLLAFPPNGELVTAYSNGLDSFAVARLVASGQIALGGAVRGKRNLVLVTTGQKINAELQGTYSPYGYTVRLVSVPLFVIPRFGTDFQLREQSYRTRALIFQTVAALAAAQSQGNTVVIGESGQGSLGPWLTVTEGEVADIRTHPIFTSTLTKVLEPVLGAKIQFSHPQIWNTKGETLKQLLDNGLQEGWEQTFSCAAQVRHQKHKGRRLQCGVCPNCLLRRQSLLAAGLEDRDSSYDYRCTPVVGEASSRGRKKTLRTRIAQGLLPLVELAKLKETPLLARTAERQVANFARDFHLDPQEVSKKVDRLIEAHGRELRAFVNRRPANSIIREFGEALL